MRKAKCYLLLGEVLFIAAIVMFVSSLMHATDRFVEGLLLALATAVLSASSTLIGIAALRTERG